MARIDCRRILPEKKPATLCLLASSVPMRFPMKQTRSGQGLTACVRSTLEHLSTLPYNSRLAAQANRSIVLEDVCSFASSHCESRPI